MITRNIRIYEISESQVFFLYGIIWDQFKMVNLISSANLLFPSMRK